MPILACIWEGQRWGSDVGGIRHEILWEGGSGEVGSGGVTARHWGCRARLVRIAGFWKKKVMVGGDGQWQGCIVQLRLLSVSAWAAVLRVQWDAAISSNAPGNVTKWQ